MRKSVVFVRVSCAWAETDNAPDHFLAWMTGGTELVVPTHHRFPARSVTTRSLDASASH